jgi:hypothetical protein
VTTIPYRGACANVMCSQFGCQGHCGWPRYGYYAAPQPQGCICPPTSEKTCQSPTCPRKPWRGTASGTLTVGGDVKQAPGDSLSGPAPEGGDAQGRQS